MLALSLPVKAGLKSLVQSPLDIFSPCISLASLPGFWLPLSASAAPLSCRLPLDSSIRMRLLWSGSRQRLNPMGSMLLLVFCLFLTLNKVSSSSLESSLLAH
jgi:hypothetical protein